MGDDITLTIRGLTAEQAAQAMSELRRQPQFGTATFESMPSRDDRWDDAWRWAAWTACPHDGKYGDDGEMQCRGTDFRRQPIKGIVAHLAAATPVERPAGELDEADGYYRCEDDTCVKSHYHLAARIREDKR